MRRKPPWESPLLRKTFVLVAILIGFKLLVHLLGLEFLSLSNLFSGIIAADVFLMGFLLSGVLSDYKEAEKLPGEIAASISAIHTEFRFLSDHKQDENSKRGLATLARLVGHIEDWFFKNMRTSDLLEKMKEVGDVVYDLESITQAAFVTRLKNELALLSKLIIRCDTIRDTSFIGSGYFLAKSVTVLLCAGLALLKLEPFYESMFVVSVIAYLIIFLLLLINDLDNPFGYNDPASTENVSLHPIERVGKEIRQGNQMSVGRI
jgi:predicted membrane chloride channel (bestrophin family)